MHRVRCLCSLTWARRWRYVFLFGRGIAKQSPHHASCCPCTRAHAANQNEMFCSPAFNSPALPPKREAGQQMAVVQAGPQRRQSRAVLRLLFPWVFPRPTVPNRASRASAAAAEAGGEGGQDPMGRVACPCPHCSPAARPLLPHQPPAIPPCIAGELNLPGCSRSCGQRGHCLTPSWLPSAPARDTSRDSEGRGDAPENACFLNSFPYSHFTQCE